MLLRLLQSLMTSLLAVLRFQLSEEYCGNARRSAGLLQVSSPDPLLRWVALSTPEICMQMRPSFMAWALAYSLLLLQASHRVGHQQKSLLNGRGVSLSTGLRLPRFAKR